MKQILYLQIDQNIQVNHPKVTLQDIAKLTCSDEEALNRVRVLTVLCLDAKKPGRYVLTVSDVVKAIQKQEPSLTVLPLGEPDFIISYQINRDANPILTFFKISLVCLISFFGGAFSIMTFNTDVDAGGLFSKIYTQVMGTAPQGISVLEIAYSLGIGLGVIFFFNHFGQMKFSSDPTPMQIQMRLYEDDINTTIIEDLERWQGHSGS